MTTSSERETNLADTAAKMRRRHPDLFSQFTDDMLFELLEHFQRDLVRDLDLLFIDWLAAHDFIVEVDNNEFTAATKH